MHRCGMQDIQTVDEAFKQFALMCLGRAQDCGDPAVRAWWTSAAQGWYQRASEAKGLGPQAAKYQTARALGLAKAAD